MPREGQGSQVACVGDDVQQASQGRRLLGMVRKLRMKGGVQAGQRVVGLDSLGEEEKEDKGQEGRPPVDKWQTNFRTVRASLNGNAQRA